MEGPAPTSNTCSVFWKLWVSACGPPAWLTSTLPVAFWMGPTRMGRSTRMGLVSGHAQPGGSMGQGSKLRFQDQADWSQLSSITSMPRVTAAKPPSLSRNNGYKVLSTSWHRKRASYVIVLILKSCLAMQALRPTCCVALCKSLHFSKLGVQPIYNPSLLAGEAVILFPWQPICLSRDHLDHIILARCCPGNQVFVFTVKPCMVVILLTGDRVVARQVVGRKHGHLGQVCPCYSWAQREADPRVQGSGQ